MESGSFRERRLSRLSFVLLAVLVGLSAVRPCRAQFNYPNFAHTKGLSLVGNAEVVGKKTLRLTGTTTWQGGALWHIAPQKVEDGFITTFQFQITDPGGIYPGGADGLTFLIQNAPEGINALGGLGDDIGYGGLSSNVAIEFDTWKNADLGDPNNNHISVHTNGTGPNNPNVAYSLGDNADLPFVMADGQVHTVQIVYVPGTLSVIVDAYPILNVNVDLQSKLALPAGKAIVGFTSSTGAAWENHDILSWSMVPKTRQAQQLFVSDNINGLIYTVSPSGADSVFATVNSPKALAFDKHGNLFEVDNGSREILEFSSGGSRTVFASGLSDPWGLAFDSNGNLFVSDRGTNSIYKFTPTGVRTTFAFNLNSPNGLAFDQHGNLFEADAGSGQILQFNSHGVQSKFASGLNNPYGLAFDAVGNLFEADSGTGQILEFAPSGHRRVFASGLNGPRGLAFDNDDNLFEADSASGTVFKFTPFGVQSAFVSLYDPVGLAFDK
jgi:sugar lactone lactonase YvrE